MNAITLHSYHDLPANLKEKAKAEFGAEVTKQAFYIEKALVTELVQVGNTMRYVTLSKVVGFYRVELKSLPI